MWDSGIIAGMTTIASETTKSATAVAPTFGMATIVLMVEWIVKQLQMLKEKQSQIESQERQIEALKKENEQLKDALDKLKNRDSHTGFYPTFSRYLKEAKW